MYNVLDVCRHIINYSNDREYGVSNLKLQKLLYFVQAAFLTETKDGEPCFNEKIEAWAFGPVVPEAYYEYRQYGSADIPYIKSYLVYPKGEPWKAEREKYDATIIAEGDATMINEVVDMLSEYTASDLVTITHSQAPWKNAYRKDENNEITIESIRDYFNGKAV